MNDKSFTAIVDDRKAKLTVWGPADEPPEGYKKLKVAYHDFGNAYNPDTLTIYQGKSKRDLVFEVYRDGCFEPYYGRISFFPNSKIKK